MTIEICANSRQSALNALAGGAGRIEMCRQLELGGTTPTEDDIRYSVHELNLRTHVLVRPRAGNFVYTDAEFEQICREVELCQDPLEALESIIRCGCHRLLTSGCQPNAEEGIPTLRQLVRHAAGRITILAGAGITPANAARIVQETAVTEIHGSCKHTLPDGTIETDPQIVRQLIKSISQ